MTGGLLQLSGIVIDLVHRVDHVPEAGEEVESAAVLATAGGGFNAMVAARRFGVRVQYGGVFGTGLFADMARAMLEAAGIDCLISRRPALDQGTCVVLVDAGGERSFISCHGAERQLEMADCASLSPKPDDWVLLSGYGLCKAESATVLAPWLERLPAGPFLLFDPGPMVAEIPPERLRPALARADWVSLNLAEARVLTGAADPTVAVRLLCRNRAGAIIRAGAEGCWVATAPDDAIFIPAFGVDSVDSTGAGDCHDGAFIAASILGYAPAQAALLANASAAVSTTRAGPATAASLAEAMSLIAARGLNPPHVSAQPPTPNRRN